MEFRIPINLHNNILFDQECFCFSPFTELLGNLEELKNVRHSDPRPSQQKKTSIIKSGKVKENLFHLITLYVKDIQDYINYM